MGNRKPIAIKHEYIRPNPNLVCSRWSCRWNPSHFEDENGEHVLITSLVFNARDDDRPARICNCKGYWYTQKCYHTDILEEHVLKIHLRELAQYEARLASAQDQYNKAKSGELKIRGKKYDETKRECEKILIDAIESAKNYFHSYRYLLKHLEEVEDFPHITKHTQLMRREYHAK